MAKRSFLFLVSSSPNELHNFQSQQQKKTIGTRPCTNSEFYAKCLEKMNSPKNMFNIVRPCCAAVAGGDRNVNSSTRNTIHASTC